MLNKALKSTTQDHLNVYTIKDDLLILKDGSAALVLQLNAINFGLLSEQEQDAIIYAYASLLNSLSFPVQILMRSIRKDISDYIQRLDNNLKQTQSQKLKEQVVKYRSFIKNLVKKNKVLEKKFYLVIPYSQLTLKETFSQGLNPFSSKQQKPSYKIDYILKKAKDNLFPRRDHLISQFSSLGLQAQQLNTKQLMALFYKIYNPDNPEGLPNQAEPDQYQTTAVQAQKKSDTQPEQTQQTAQTPASTEQQPPKSPHQSINNQQT